MVVEFVLSFDGLFTVWAYADNRDRGLELLLQESDVVGESLGELSLAAHLCEVSLPTWHLSIDWLNQTVADVVWEVACDATVLQFVGGAGLDGVEAIEHVALHHDELGHAADHDGVTESHEVNPTTTAFTTCHSTIFMTDVAHLLAGFIEQLCGEWTSTDTCAVCLDDAEYIANLVRTNTQADASTSTDGVGRGDEWVRTEVDVEHRALSTFAKNRLALLQELVDFVLRIDELELLDVLNAFHPLLLHLCDVIVGIVEALENSLMTCPMPLPVVPTLFLPLAAS